MCVDGSESRYEDAVGECKECRGKIDIHGDPSGIKGRLLDVGIDNAYNIFGEHKLFSDDEVHEILNPIDFNGFSHHNRDSDEYIKESVKC